MLACLIALIALIWKTVATPGQAWQVPVLVAMAIVSLVVEWSYRAVTGRSIVLKHL
ncbi:MAG: hypothetical protein GY876_09260 [Planctomycetes bacterium]|nr:hypothetical protein [Planctomycetota bacterium]